MYLQIGTQALGQSGTWALRALKHLDTRVLKVLEAIYLADSVRSSIIFIIKETSQVQTMARRF